MEYLPVTTLNASAVRRLWLVGLLLTCSVAGLVAQEDTADDPFADLFEVDDIFEEVDEDFYPFADPTDDPLVSDLVVWSGRFLGSLGGSWNWIDPWNEGLLEPDAGPLATTLGADLRFDARPARDYRVLGSFQIRATGAGGAAVPGGLDGFTPGDDDLASIIEQLSDDDGNLPVPGLVPDGDDDDAPAGGSPTLELSVFELFADFNWDERMFFRFGKHTISWGVGFLFSPADVLNLTAINPQDPDGDIEGPVSLRTRVPFGRSAATLYLVVPDGGEVLDLALAPQLLLEIGETELGLAAWYQRRRPPRGIVTLRRGIGEFDLFAEGVVAWGSERTFLEALEPDNEFAFRTFEQKSGLFPSATAGFRRLDDVEGLGSVLVAAQYLYNGDGYASNELPGRDETVLQMASAVLAQQAAAAAGILVASPLVSPDDPTLAFNDIAPLTTGRHYAALTFGVSELAGSRFGTSVFGIVNMSDWSGFVSPGLSVRFTDRMNLNATTLFSFGSPGSEFGNPVSRVPGDGIISGEPVFPDSGPAISFNVSVSLGGGSF